MVHIGLEPKLRRVKRVVLGKLHGSFEEPSFAENDRARAPSQRLLTWHAIQSMLDATAGIEVRLTRGCLPDR